MGWPTKYSKSQITEALNKGQLARVVNNGWARLNSSSTNPTLLGDLKEPGNYVTSFYSDGPNMGEDVLTPINVVVTNIGSDIYQYITTADRKFYRVMKSGTQVYGAWGIEKIEGAINPGPNPPIYVVNGETMWLDTSKPSSPSLKVFVNSEWKTIIPEGSMKSSIYDKHGRNINIYKYIDDIIAESGIGVAADAYEEHDTNTEIHVTATDRAKWNNHTSIAEINDIVNEFKNNINSKLGESLSDTNADIDLLAERIPSLNNNIVDHSNMQTIHPSSAKQTEWDNKSDRYHTHELDDRVTVDIDHVNGVIPEYLLPYDIKERVYVVNSTIDMYKLNKNPIHSGDIICVEGNGASSWYGVVDDTQMGVERLSSTWAESQVGTSNRNWYSVCYGNGRFVAIAFNGNIAAYSNDGITWNEVSISSSDRNWRAVCYGNGKFVAVSYSSTKFAYSSDGITWKEIDVGTSNKNWVSICYGNGKFVAVAVNSETFAYSSDGITWSFGTMAATEKSWYQVCYGANKFVAIITNSNEYAYSNDGITWTLNTITDTVRYYQSICYGNGKFVIVSSDPNNSNVFAYSVDGINWKETTLDGARENWYYVINANGIFVAVSHVNSKFAYSEDGIYWEVRKMVDTSRSWSSLCYGNGKFVTTAYDSNVFAHGTLLINPSSAFVKIPSVESMIDWNRIINKPENGTFATYNITDGVSTTEINEVKDNITDILENMPADYTLNDDAASEHQYYTESLNRINELDSDLVNSIGPVIDKLENSINIFNSSNTAVMGRGRVGKILLGYRPS